MTNLERWTAWQQHCLHHITTALCLVWGFFFSLGFFETLFQKAGVLASVVSALPIITVWGALQRKRWGRLALMSLCMIIIMLFIVVLTAISSTHQFYVLPEERTLYGYLHYALHFFSHRSVTSVLLLTLSGLTCLWFWLPPVRKEYEKGKRATLALGQKVIALSLVFTWALTMLYTPTTAEQTGKFRPLRSARRITMRF